MYPPVVAFEPVSAGDEISIAGAIALDVAILELLVVVQLVDAAVVAQDTLVRLSAAVGGFSTPLVVHVQAEERGVILAEHTRPPT